MAHADPAAEHPAVAVTCGAEMHVVGPAGERVVAAEDFFVGHLTTALEPGEVLTEVSFPVMSVRRGDASSGWAFRELSRRHGDFALVGTSVTLSVDSAGRCRDVRLVVFGVGGVPLRVVEAERVLEGQEPGSARFGEAARVVERSIQSAMSDVHATAEYRRHLAGVLTRRALEEAVASATGTAP